jgi:hypothetical protein
LRQQAYRTRQFGFSLDVALAGISPQHQDAGIDKDRAGPQRSQRHEVWRITVQGHDSPGDEVELLALHPPRQVLNDSIPEGGIDRKRAGIEG